MQQWQYRTLRYGWDEAKQDLVWADTKELVVDAKMVDRRLNELGGEGWELVSIEKMSDVAHVAICFYLKRPVEKETE
jgi:hypothetical protein